jgi:hypothetical protein
MSSDPVLAVIAEHRRIYEAWEKAPRDGRDIAEQPITELYLDASNRLFQTAPTTIAGTLALLDYVIGKHDCIGHWGVYGVDFAGAILESIREGLVTATAA